MVGRRGATASKARIVHRGAMVLAVVCALLVLIVSIAYLTARPDDKSDAVTSAVEGGAAPPEPSGEDELVSGPWRLSLWLVLLTLLTLGWICLGRAFSKSWRAIFIGRSNRLSLSQTQFVLWTLLFASAVLAVFLIRIRGLPGADGLGVSVPLAAGGLLGISSLSFGGAAAIHARKRNQVADPRDVDRLVRRQLSGVQEGRPSSLLGAVPSAKGETPVAHATKAAAQLKDLQNELKGKTLGTGLEEARKSAKLQATVEGIQAQLGKESDGLLARNLDPRDAHLLNLVQGDEILNRDSLDLGKVQMAGFTLLAIVAYAIALGRFFLDGVFYEANGPGLPTFDTLPAISDGVVALLGASQAGYLGAKGAGATRGIA